MDDDARVDFEFAAVTDKLPQPMVVLDGGATIRYANASAGHLLKIAPTQLVGTSALSLVHQRDRRRLQRELASSASGMASDRPSVYRVRSADGSWKHVLVVASPIAKEDNGILLAATDVTRQVEEASEFEDLALRDAITDLPNRRAITNLVERTLSEAKDPVGVAFIDLDHFRRVNDCYNHTVGDEVLRAVAARLRLASPPGCSLGHFGADNFVAVFVGHDEASATQVLWELVTRLANPMFVSGHELRLSATAGIAFSDPTATFDTLLRDADVAVTRAKAECRGGITAFTQEMGRETAERLAIEVDLSHALERKELRVVYQPIVSLSSGEVESREALLRWDRRQGEPVAPSDVVALAEDIGLIVPIGNWVISQVLQSLVDPSAPPTAVNLSPSQLLDPELPNRVERSLRLWGVDARRLIFEITESVLIENFELASESLQRLRMIGCPVGLDDFGTGYSSLGYLRRLPVDFLKLDRQLVEDVDLDRQSEKIVRSIVALAASLELTTYAEGVEREEQAELLRAMACKFGQGWLFGRPS